MATTLSGANLGGDEADHIGMAQEHKEGIPDEITPPDTHGHNTIYLDNSITFENYHYWANRSRQFEKHIRTDNVGLRQLANLVLGRKVPAEQPALDVSQNDVSPAATEKVSDNDNKHGPSDEKTSGDGAIASSSGGGWQHGVTEAEWEQAQRATRTATWGE